MPKNKILSKMISAIAVIAITASIALFVPMTGCAESEHVNYNMNKDAMNFNINRRITVYNVLRGDVILEAEGLMNIDNNAYNELVVTIKTGENKFKQNHIYINKLTTYTVEDIEPNETDPYRYIWQFHTTPPVDVEIVK